MNKFSKLARAGTLASLGLAATANATEVMFIDGGYAEMCSTLAHNLGEVAAVELTGSRLGIPPLEICTRAIEEEMSTPDQLAASYTNRGVLLFDQGSLDAALADFDQALVRSETLAAAHINRGYTLVALQRWADSIPAFDRGLTLGAPDPAKAHFNRAIAHEELGHIREAYQDYLKASELAPEWDEPKRELARFSVR